jgi:hypothetical protein
MKILIEKETNIVKWGFDNNETLLINSDKIIAGSLPILDLNSENSELVEGVSEPPTPLFQNLYKWENSDWKLLWDVQKKIAQIEKKCSELLLEDPSGNEDEWNNYIDKVNYILDNLLININPLYVEYPKKP